MRRRQFIKVVAAAAAWPRGARAQPALPVVGFLNSASAIGYASELAQFHDGLKEAGYTAGQDVSIEYRWAENDYQRLPTLVADLVRRKVNVIVANGPAAPSAISATQDIPIVFTADFDPVRLGLVERLNRPGRNVTGISILNVEVAPKRLELLRELLPGASSIALLINPNNPNADVLSNDVGAAAQRLGLQLPVLKATDDREIEAGFQRLAQLRAGGLIIGNDPFFTTRSRRLAELAMRDRIAAIYQYRDFTAAGGLLSYGGSLKATYRLAGLYAGRILKGEKPAELPIQQSTNLELIINLKAAKALGLSVPLPLLGRADEVIE
jgi:putative tryptophan/tyrosine transport system substrate-binding protein